jgi:predicted ferric reductase
MTITWFVIRGSGLAAFAMLGIATVWGLLVSTKVMGRAVKAKGMSWFHESIGLAALIATGVHMIALALDEYVEFGVRDLLVPGVATWRPLAVALGVTGFYGVAVVGLSFYVKAWIGQSAWRAIHYTAFGTFAAVTAHGIMAGTDTGNPITTAMYIGFTVAVGLLLVIRIATALVRTDRTPAAASRRATGPSAVAGDREGRDDRRPAQAIAVTEGQ